MLTTKRHHKAVPVEVASTPSWHPRFGTDGIRGRANHELTPIIAMRLGQAVASRLARGGPMVVAQDTRRSGDMLSAGLIAGMTSVGADVTTLGVAPTAALAFVAGRWRYDGGVMVSASHNPASDNGLKVLDGSGLKLDASEERRLEALMAAPDQLPAPGNHAIGHVIDGSHEVERYREHRIAIARRTHARMRVVVDCANGAASVLAPAILERTGADISVIGASPNGSNINDGFGATCPGALAAKVREVGADIGIAFDGDADRCVVVDERGRVVHGDALLGLLAIDRLDRGALAHGVLVATVVSNGGLDEALARHGGHVQRTPVGDRSVWTGMASTGASLGGEQSGHVIIRDHASTGDGILTALEVMDVMVRTERPISHLSAEITLWPQQERSVQVSDRESAIADAELEHQLRLARGHLGGGRILVRPSGTEPVIRIMVEGPDDDRVSAVADGLADLVRERHASR